MNIILMHNGSMVGSWTLKESCVEIQELGTDNQSTSQRRALKQKACQLVSSVVDQLGGVASEYTVLLQDSILCDSVEEALGGIKETLENSIGFD